MSRGAFLSNGADNEFADDDEGRKQRAIQAQLEALGSTRRHVISTQGYKEDIKYETSSLRAVEGARRVNQSGTAESRISNDVKRGLTGWSNAWRDLKADGTAEDTLDSMKDGQTHREKLMSDPSVRDYKEGAEDFGRGSYGRQGTSDRPRGGGRGGRGGGHMGSRSGRIPTGVDQSIRMSMDDDKKATRRKGRGTFLDSPPDKAFYSSSKLAIHGEKAAPPLRKASGVPARIESKLASPSSFMAAARPKSSLKKAEEVPVASSKAQTAPRTVQADRPALATPNAFMAAAKNMFKTSLSKEVEIVLPSIKPLSQKEKPQQPALKASIKEQEPKKQPAPKTSIKEEEPKQQSAAKMPTKEEELQNIAAPLKSDITIPAVKVNALTPSRTSVEAMDLDPGHTWPDFGAKAPVQISMATSVESFPKENAPFEPSPATDLEAEVNRLLSMLGNNMSHDLRTHLQGALSVQAILATPQKSDAAASSGTPKIVVKIPQLVNATINSTNTETLPTKSFDSRDEVPTQHDALAKVINEPLVLSKVITTVRVPAAIEQVAAKALQARPPVSRPPPQAVRTIGSTVHTHANIFGEHVFKDRYASRSDSVTSPVDSLADSLDSVNAAFGRFSLREQNHAAPKSQLQSSAVKDMAELDTPAPEPTIKDAQQGPVKSRFIARNTPNLVDNAITRQYLGKRASNATSSGNFEVQDSSQAKIAKNGQQPGVQSQFSTQAASNLIGDAVTRSAAAKNVDIPLGPKGYGHPTIIAPKDVEPGFVKSRFVARETSNLMDNAATRQYAGQGVSTAPQYASANPFAQAPSKQSSIASSHATSDWRPFVQPALNEKSRASTQASSTEGTPAAAKNDSPPKQRYATTPYTWLEPPKRPGENRAEKLQLPAFLQGIQPNPDTATAARAQYNRFAKKENEAPAKGKDHPPSGSARGY